MSTIVEISHDYPVSVEDLWHQAMDLPTLSVLNAPLIVFGKMPRGRMYQGLVIDTTVSVYGRLKPQPYRIEIVSCDDTRMRAVTHETGAGVERWDHVISVTPSPEGARLTDRIEIDAGWLTAAYAWWARKLYRHRDRPRRTILGLEDA
jgi:hypothetical protein